MGKTFDKKIRALIYYKFSILLLLIVVTCKSTAETDFFDKFIVSKYNACHNLNDCEIDLKKLPFNWDKFYIFSENHYPEISTSRQISSVLGTFYSGDIEANERLIVFIYKGEICYEIKTVYEKDGFADLQKLFVDFNLDKNTPLFFKSSNARFKIKKINNYYELYWVNLEK